MVGAALDPADPAPPHRKVTSRTLGEKDVQGTPVQKAKVYTTHPPEGRVVITYPTFLPTIPTRGDAAAMWQKASVTGSVARRTRVPALLRGCVVLGCGHLPYPKLGLPACKMGLKGRARSLPHGAAREPLHLGKMTTAFRSQNRFSRCAEKPLSLRTGSKVSFVPTPRSPGFGPSSP